MLPLITQLTLILICTYAAQHSNTNERLSILKYIVYTHTEPTATSQITRNVNKHDKLRIPIIKILNYKKIENATTEYKWEELTGFNIKKYQSTQNNMNLILKPGVLEMGGKYTFRVRVTQTMDIDGNLIGYGVSKNINIHVSTAPTVIGDSFNITPPCNTQYKTILDAISQTYSFKLLSDGFYLPLQYQFGYNDNNYLHNKKLSNPSLDDVYIPLIGDFKVFVNIYDSKLTKVTSTIDCAITFMSYKECPNFNKDIIRPYLSQSVNIFNRSMMYLEYLKFGAANGYLNYKCIVKQF
eukprot:23213_1